VRAFFVSAPEDDLVAAGQRIHNAALELLIELAENAGQGRAGHLFRRAESIRHGLKADWCELALLLDSTELEVQLSSGQGVWLGAPYPFVALDTAPDLHQAVSAQLPLTFTVDQPDLSAGARALLHSTRSSALLALPLVQRGQSYGLVMFGHTRAHHLFSERDINLGRAIVGQAATALENARLVHDLEQSLQDLKDAQERLVQAARLSAMGELAAAVAHQINNPLTTILVDTELMLLDEPAHSRNYRSLVAISRAGKRAASVVRRLLATARPAEENAPVEPIDVLDTIEGILSLVKSHIEQDGIRIVTKLPDESLPPVLAVQGQLDDIWLNLLLNAHDALAGREQARIGIEAAYIPGSAYVDVVVWDNGPGVPEAIRQDIFEPFFTTKPVGEGTGLGLHICRQVIDRVGGSISVDNASEGGARFLVRLPVRKG
jgi:C4-dicarboxylate-specific signal transduction histidine kinase